MKGIVYRLFIDFVEDNMGPEAVENMIDACDLPSGGAYTSAGYYDHSEIIAMVGALSAQTKIPAPALVTKFGRHLFGCLAGAHPEFLGEIKTVFDFLPMVDRYIHVEVLKLYPEAELPKISTEAIGADTLKLHYESKRGFADLAEGLILGCMDHFDDQADLAREDQTAPGAVPGSAACFTLTRKAA